MKKEKSKKNITISIPLISILVGGVIILSIVTSYAATMIFDSNNVNYDNTTSGIRSSNVQGAIDELYACASNYSAYDTRLTDTEDIIGNTTLSTTAPTLTGGVNELNDQIDTLQGDATWTTISSKYPTYYRKIFGIVFVVMRLNGGETPSDGEIIGTLPSGYRPVYQITASTHNLRGAFMVNTNGEISINANNGLTLNNYMGVVVAYPV